MRTPIILCVVCCTILGACDLANSNRRGGRDGQNGDGAATNNQSTVVQEQVEFDEQQFVAAIAALPALDESFTNQSIDYGTPLPSHFMDLGVQSLNNTPSDNAFDNARIHLGRALFYDRRLSRNGTKSCASCHKPDAAFGDDVALSDGFDGGRTGRNSMPLLNVKYYGRERMFWDERAATLEEQVLMPIQDQVEMGLNLRVLRNRVANADFYQPMFEDAFGTTDVTTDKIGLALAQFVRAIVAVNAPWDEGVQRVNNVQDDFPNYTAAQNRGKQLFFRGGNDSCASCHLPAAANGNGRGGRRGGNDNDTDDNVAIFYMDAVRDNGLPDNVDNGVGDANGDDNDDGKFKSPSLRNVGQSAPYMHDGRFATLAEVMEFYDNGIANTENLDNRIPGRGFNLNRQEREDLIAFLLTLDDASVVSDSRFHNPFDR